MFRCSITSLDLSAPSFLCTSVTCKPLIRFNSLLLKLGLPFANSTSFSSTRLTTSPTLKLPTTSYYANGQQAGTFKNRFFCALIHVNLPFHRCTISYPTFHSGHAALRLKIGANIFSCKNIQDDVFSSAIRYNHGDAAGSGDFSGFDFALDSSSAQVCFCR